MPKLNPKIKKYIPPFFAAIILALGGVFMLVPFIPLGYIFIFIGLFMLSRYLPFVRKWINKLKKKDDNNMVEGVERKIVKIDGKINSWLTEDSENTNEKDKA